MPNSKKSIQFYYDKKKDGDIEKRLKELAAKKLPGLDLSISQITKFFILTKLKEEEEKGRRQEQKKQQKMGKGKKLKVVNLEDKDRTS
ncbi:MAG TPA: hypothetical protein VIH20_02375 [Candidatus Subteraquimicrobiales bacterium]